MISSARSATALLLFASLSLCLLNSGCSWKQPPQPDRDKFAPSQSAILHVPPKELVHQIVQSLPAGELAIPIDHVQDGTIITDWKEYPGAIHIVRRWRERSRFRIEVAPDFNDPLGTSHLEIFEETQEKPSDAQPWYPNPDLRRPERSEQVLKFIENDIKVAK